METKAALDIRLQMEALISQREAMKALNEYRSMRGETQAYDEGAFFTNAEAFQTLAALVRAAGGKER